MDARRVAGPLLRTRAGRAAREAAGRAVRRRRTAKLPLLSVIVPFHDSVGRLAECLESLLTQTHPNLQVVLVDDGSVDGSAEVAEDYARRHRNVILVHQEHAGVGAARNAGVRAATGAYLAFCDSDDTVVSDGYARMVDALETSGSDLVVGSVTLQTNGRHLEPAWARRSNPNRRLGTTVEASPHTMANLITGSRMFRRSFWDAQGLVFDTDGDHSDIVTVVRALLVCDRLDILPAVVYRWWWREDGRSLWQQGLLDQDRVADRLRRICEAGRLVVELAPEEVQGVFLSDILHTTVPELVRAAVARDDSYWGALSVELRELIALLTDQNFLRVPFEDRVVAWMCAHDHRQAVESFLEYAFDNQNGYPYTVVDGHPHVSFSFIDEIDESTFDLTRIAQNEMRFRTRLVSMRWVRPGVLALEGAAFVEYVDDRQGTSEVTVLLRSRGSGSGSGSGAGGTVEQRVATTPAPDLDVNQWASRAHEDHAGAGFRCEVDVSSLGLDPTGNAVVDVSVELAIGSVIERGPFLSRQVSGSAGLLETSRCGALTVTPVWRSFGGLRLATGERAAGSAPGPDLDAPIRVDRLTARGGLLVLEGTCDDERAEVALIGPRGRSEWSRVECRDDGATVTVSLFEDEWGLGETPLPMDRYVFEARDATGHPLRVVPTVDLWRSLPVVLEDRGLHIHPHVFESGDLGVRLAPVEWRTSRPAYLRRRLRDEVYPAARTRPLLDVAFFETFAGKAAGDNPGALCKELASRSEGLELVFSVLDRSVEVPQGARGVVRFSTEYFELLGRARYLIVNASLPYFFRKREGQLYFQTWHGSPLKRIAHDRPHLDFFNWHHRRQLLLARDGWDFLLSQSDFCTTALRSAFRYKGEVMELGYPRNDLLSSADADSVRARTRKSFGIGDDERVVLYAPTWRDNARVGRVFDKVLYLDPHEVVDRVPGTVMLVRGHYNSVRAAETYDPDRRVVDVTRYPDIADLYLAADALVTDYSSVFFDFVLTDKPMVFLAPDLSEYRDDNRGFYLDYHETVPGPICVTTDEVVAELTAPDAYAERRDAFRARYAPYDDGSASARVIDAILAWGRQTRRGA